MWINDSNKQKQACKQEHDKSVVRFYARERECVSVKA